MDGIERLLVVRNALVRLLGWFYVTVGAVLSAGLIRVIVGKDAHGTGEWTLLVAPLFLLMAVLFTTAGYRVLRDPPLHQRSTILLGFVLLVSLFLLRSD